MAARPRHEALRGHITAILRQGFGASYDEIAHEVYLLGNTGRIDTLWGAVVIELKSDLRRELADVQARMPDYLADAARRNPRPPTGIATDGATFIGYQLIDGQLKELRRYETDPERPGELMAWLELLLSDDADLMPDARAVAQAFGRGSLAFSRARLTLQGLWHALKDDPEVRLKRDLWDGLLREAYGAEVGDDTLFLQHTYLAIIVGYRHLVSWLLDAETKWMLHANLKADGEPRMTLRERLDYQRTLSGQAALSDVRVVYTKAGTRLSATILHDKDPIIDHKAYWAVAKSIAEAAYLTAILNSAAVLAKIIDLQSHGQRDKRDFDNLVWTLPIPEYDDTEQLHRDLAAAAARAETIAATVELTETQHFTAKRRAIRAALTETGIAAENRNPRRRALAPVMVRSGRPTIRTPRHSKTPAHLFIAVQRNCKRLSKHITAPRDAHEGVQCPTSSPFRSGTLRPVGRR